MSGLLGILGENMDILHTMLDLLDSYLLLDAAGVIQVGEAASLLSTDAAVIDLWSTSVRRSRESFDDK